VPSQVNNITGNKKHITKQQCSL